MEHLNDIIHEIERGSDAGKKHALTWAKQGRIDIELHTEDSREAYQAGVQYWLRRVGITDLDLSEIDHDIRQVYYGLRLGLMIEGVVETDEVTLRWANHDLDDALNTPTSSQAVNAGYTLAKQYTTPETVKTRIHQQTEYIPPGKVISILPYLKKGKDTVSR